MVSLLIERDEHMSSKHKSTNKQMASLGITKNRIGDYEYINPEDENNSKYKSIKKLPKQK